MLSVNEINLLQAQNEGLKKQNVELQKENAELKAEIETLKSQLDFEVQKKEVLEVENERLKEEIKEVKKYQYEQEFLEKEIEEMQKALKTLAEGLNIRQQTLQEIKDIIHEQLMWQGQLPQCELEILQKITKAESEDNQ